MAEPLQLPCNGDGVCMLCGIKPSSFSDELITCNTCVTPWHVPCLSSPPPLTLASTIHFQCPDCSIITIPTTSTTTTTTTTTTTIPIASVNVKPVIGSDNSGTDLVAAIRAIEADTTLTEIEKAKKRQKLLSGRDDEDGDEDDSDDEKKHKGDSKNDVAVDLFGGSFNCAFCMQLLERPVTTPCGHNFCLKCFTKWVGQGKNTCAKCRHTIPYKMTSQPRINSTLVAAIRMARMSKSIANGGPPKVYHFLHNQNRPDAAFTTERAKKAGKANAASGKIFVTIPRDHFGPITAENDPVRNQGVMVGECWADRMECRQWGAHFPHVSGISGQSKHGAQSVALSGGYEDDEDHGEWFLYTGSGGRDLSGNKRTNKEQSFDQRFELSNEALRVSCLKGYPVRVVRSHKEKRSSYAPPEGVRYDGIYRIEKCWRKVGKQGYKVCRYLFVRCDNDPAPWTSDEHGDRPRPLPVVSELKHATDITERKRNPSWDYGEKTCWNWKAPQPQSMLPVETQDPEDRRRVRAVIRQTQNLTVTQKLLKEFNCLLCSKVMTLPLTTPCAHNFCKPCLEAAFAGKTFIRERAKGGRSLRAQKNVMKCPSCPVDISDFLQNPQVNRELMNVIESLQRKNEENEVALEETSKEDTEFLKEETDAASGSLPKDTGKKDSDSSAEKTDVVSKTAETILATSEKFGVTEDLPNPPKDCKPKRSYKQQKVDTGGCSLESSNSEEHNISTDVVAEVGHKEVSQCNTKHSKKRKVGDGVELRQNVGVRTRSKKAQDVDDGNGSP